jgi:hypothetical protein
MIMLSRWVLASGWLRAEAAVKEIIRNKEWECSHARKSAQMRLLIRRKKLTQELRQMTQLK